MLAIGEFRCSEHLDLCHLRPEEAAHIPFIQHSELNVVKFNLRQMQVTRFHEYKNMTTFGIYNVTVFVELLGFPPPPDDLYLIFTNAI